MYGESKDSQANTFAFLFGMQQLGQGKPRVDVKDDRGERATFSIAGTPYALLVREGEEVVVSLHVVDSERGWALKKGYEPDPHHAGWLSIRLGRGAKGWADANVGGLATRAIAHLTGT